MTFTVITENDESQWNDVTGEAYHFPKRYLDFLKPGTKVIYYKGKLKNKVFKKERLTNEPHYFGVATIGAVNEEFGSAGRKFIAEIRNFERFLDPVPIKIDGQYMESIPERKKSNYWRDGVRPISEEVYIQIVTSAGLYNYSSKEVETSSYGFGEETTSPIYREGEEKTRTTTVYERDRRLRAAAIRHHGVNCAACGFNFGDFYGKYAEGYIQVHHINPLSHLDGPVDVDPKTDLVPLCANCHAVVHYKPQQVLSVTDIKALIAVHGKR
ncbi:restriction endonuclease [Rhodobacteraceae bacterium RKSG542]|uniref:HNH endonuclease n=1 Tax=Pseudovibrio flavus TaxID=2529854 RepID=UPI0012BD6754|nr:HNH endonuclease [Pseudovibrio flavus]MTI16200.1 restriction endonuclease [Pseudovibrio flavus]